MTSSIVEVRSEGEAKPLSLGPSGLGQIGPQSLKYLRESWHAFRVQFIVHIWTKMSIDSETSRLDADNHCSPTQTVVPDAYNPRKRHPSSGLPHPRPVRKATQEKFWASKVEDIPCFDCSPLDFYEPFLRCSSGRELVLCNDRTEARVLRTGRVPSYYNNRELVRIQHKNFIGVYEMYSFEDKVSSVTEYIDFTVEDILLHSIRFTEPEIAYIIGQVSKALYRIPSYYHRIYITGIDRNTVYLVKKHRTYSHLGGERLDLPKW